MNTPKAYIKILDTSNSSCQLRQHILLYSSVNCVSGGFLLFVTSVIRNSGFFFLYFELWKKKHSVWDLLCCWRCKCWFCSIHTGVSEILGAGLMGPFHYLGALFPELEGVSKPTLKPLVLCDTLKLWWGTPSQFPSWDLQLFLKDSWRLFFQMLPVKCCNSSADLRRNEGSEREGQLYIPTELFCAIRVGLGHF